MEVLNGDSDSSSISWEDFFGTSTDLVPTLLSMYDSLIARAKQVPVPQSHHKGDYSNIQQESTVGAHYPSTGPFESSSRCPASSAPSAPLFQYSIGGAETNRGRAQVQFNPAACGVDRSGAVGCIVTSSVPLSTCTSSTCTRPLSVSSITSSSSSSTTSSLSKGVGGIVSRDTSSLLLNGHDDPNDDADLSAEDDDNLQSVPKTRTPTKHGRTDGLRKSNGSGSGDSGVCSPCSHISFPSPPAGRPRYCDPNLSYMDRVVMEIVETEGVYVKDLHQVIEGYLHQWQNFHESPLTNEQLHDLFSNIEEIHQFNSEFLQQLEFCGLDPVQVARCFVKNNCGFSIYTEYCTNYPRTVSVLTELMRSERTVKAFRERQYALQHTLPLGSYLLKPVQRILKYHLLLQNIVKHHDKDKDGHIDIVDALSAMTGIAHHINEMKRRHEHAVRVQEIQSLLYGWEGEDLTTYGELCAEGTFRVYGAKALRHVFLFDKMLLITKKREECTLSYKAHIMCSNLMLIESVPGEPLSYHVIPFDNPRLQYTLQARNLEQKREWTLQLKRVILENYNAVIPIHARQLVMQLGQCRPEDEVLAEKVSPSKKQHSAPEYLERRRKSEISLRSRLKRGRKSEGGSPKSSPSSRRRGRRGSATPSVDRSESRDREDSCERRFDDKNVKEDKQRRKSEPLCHLYSVVNNELSNEFHPTPAAEMEDKLKEEKEVPEYHALPREEENLESIVGQIVMEKLEFQRILKKQRMVSLRRALARTAVKSEETTDTENEDLSFDSEADRFCSPHFQRLNHATRSLRERSSYDSMQEKCSSVDYTTPYVPNQLQKDNSVYANTPGDSVKLDSAVSTETLSKKVQRTASDPGNKKLLMPRKSKFAGPFGNYDNLMNIWNTFRRNSVDENNAPITKAENRVSMLLHDQFTTGSSSSLESNIPLPTLPAVWLRQQHEHLATPNKKSDSLPRSFQLAPEAIPNYPNNLTSTPNRYKARVREYHNNIERPFTIASDKPTPSDNINVDDMDHYIQSTLQRHSFRFPLLNEDTEDSTTEYTGTPNVSMDNINVHPDYKIYRPSMSKSALRHIIASVSSRLASLKGGHASSTETFGSFSNLNSDTETDGKKERNNIRKEKCSNRFMSVFSKQYSKSFKQKFRHVIGNEEKGEQSDAAEEQLTSSFSGLPIYKQGSSSLGARIAHTAEASDYAVPKLPRGIQVTTNQRLNDKRPDSVLSINSNVTSSTDSNKSSNTNDNDVEVRETDNFPERVDSDTSVDSIYEKTFEAIENLLENDMFRDSAIFSDHEENESVSSQFDPKNIILMSMNENYKNNIVKSTHQQPKIPPPVPHKPEMSKRIQGKSIKAKLKNFEDCGERNDMLNSKRPVEGMKSIQERRKELEQWSKSCCREDESETSSQHSTSTVLEVPLRQKKCQSESNSTNTMPIGWVKHVVGKLQGGDSVQ